MNCEKMREWLLTDYVDETLSSSDKASVDQHLAHCPSCAVFAKQIKKYALEPFRTVRRVEPPYDLWNRIKAAIEPEPATPFGRVIIDNLLRLISLPKSIFALSSALALILIAFVSVKSPQFFTRLENHQLASIYLEEQIESMASNNGISLASLDTNIEKYLL